MKLGSLHIAIALLPLATAAGYIGNDEAELSKWYGAPSTAIKLYAVEKAVTRLYHFNGMDILVNLVDGHSWSEFYRNSDGTALTAHEIKRIVLANTGLEPPDFEVAEGIVSVNLGAVSVTFDPAHRTLYLASRGDAEKIDRDVLTIVSRDRSTPNSSSRKE